jgi:hypothetical protein
MALTLLRQAIFGKTIDDEYVKKNESAPKPVSELEWLSHDEPFFNDMSGGYTLVETSDEDMAKIEQLLEVKEGFFNSPFVIKTKCENCDKCGRLNSFLDVVATGLRVHKPKFLVDVFTGKFGYIHNSQEHQVCICYGCGNQLSDEAVKYSRPKACADPTKPRAHYTFSVKML